LTLEDCLALIGLKKDSTKASPKKAPAKKTASKRK